jgi:uncharacterized protein YbjQ (UPF0145 family)
VSWPGGLPPAATERVNRARAGRAAGSLLSAPAALTLAEVGLEPVGEVMGCVVVSWGYRGYGCGSAGYIGQYRTTGGVVMPVRASHVGIDDSVRLGVDDTQAFGTDQRAWYSTLDRLVREAGVLGADGVVGIRLDLRPLDAGVSEYLALGTAVRSRRPQPGPASETPWTTDLDGQHLATAINAGWSPRRLLLGSALAVRHDDWMQTSQVSRWNTRNQEIGGLTHLLSVARKASRAELEAAARGHSGHQVVLSGIRVSMSERECRSLGGEGRDHLARSFAVGTLLARDRRPARSGPTLRVLPLTDHRGRRPR